ncbi:hypothetical protein OIO90_001845 [Microbotryomycetes sp. JL221]|nr:hypothetical protein OIO90_001845 [Microbotryomycetes sp. JL221]
MVRPFDSTDNVSPPASKRARETLKRARKDDNGGDEEAADQLDDDNDDDKRVHIDRGNKTMSARDRDGKLNATHDSQQAPDEYYDADERPRANGRARASDEERLDEVDDQDEHHEPPRARSHGKGRARDSDNEDEDEDEDNDEDGQDNENVQAQDDVDMQDMTTEQQIEHQRKLKVKYRQLGYAATELQSNINDVSVDEIGNTIKSANKLFKQVTSTGEAVLDAHVLLAASGAAALKARALKLDANAFDTVEFINRLHKFMGGKSQNRRQSTQAVQPLEKDLKWSRIGRVLASESRRVPTCDFMFGPLEIQVKEKKARTQRQRHKINEADRVQPEELTVDDMQKSKNETAKLVKQISEVLEQYGEEGIPYLQLVVNPNSFAQTVENIFFLSFLVKEGRVGIWLDENQDSPHHGDIVCVAAEAPDEQEAAAIKSNQIVLEVTEQIWKDAIEAYELTESVVPNRAPFKPPQASHSGTTNGRRAKKSR